MKRADEKPYFEVSKSTRLSLYRRLTIEAVLELSTTSKLSTTDFSRRKQPIQNQTQGVVTESRNDRPSVEQCREPNPTNFCLQLVEGKSGGAEEARRRTSRYVVGEEGHGIAANWKTEGDEKGTNPAESLVLIAARV